MAKSTPNSTKPLRTCAKRIQTRCKLTQEVIHAVCFFWLGD